METPQITIAWLPVDRLEPNPHNPRKDVGDVTELAESIKSQGIKQELLVTPTGEHRDGEPTYRVVIGHRRLAAARQAGLGRVPCRVEEMTEREEREIMLVENTQRADLTPVEEADGYQGLLDLGAKVDEMAEATGRSRKFVRARLKIAAIPQTARDMAEDFAQLSFKELEAIASFADDADAQERLAKAAGTTDFGWTLNHLKSEREQKAWMAEARGQAEELGKTLEPIPAGQGVWSFRPDGCGPYAKCMNYDCGPLADQWQAWLDGGGAADARLFTDDHHVYVFPPLSEEQKARKEAEGREAEERRRRAAMRKEADAKLREFDRTARETREQWIRENVPSALAVAMIYGVNLLVEREFIGDGETLPNVWNDSIFDDQVILTYGRLDKPLPVTEKDPANGVPYLGCKENLDELRDRFARQGQRTRQTLLWLLARAEAHIDWDDWKSNRGRDSIASYYTILEALGYKPSQEESDMLAKTDEDEEGGDE